MPDTIIPTEPPQQVASSDAALLLAFTRLEAKVDVALTQHSADLKDLSRDRDDHETRLRALEGRPTVSPKALWTTVASILGVVLPAVALLMSFLSK